MDFVTQVPSAVAFEAHGVAAAGFPSLHNEAMIFVIQTEKYTDKLQVEQQSTNFCIFTNATLTTGGISTLDGVTLSQAGRVKKSIRHAAAIYRAFSKHKAHNLETVNIYDNELDKQNSGRLKLEFNKGIAAKQLEALKKKNIEFCKITNIYKSSPTTPKLNLPPQMVIVGAKDFDNLKILLHDASAHFKRVSDQGSAESQAAVVIADMLAEDSADGKTTSKISRKRSASPLPSKRSKKMLLSDSEDDDKPFVKTIIADSE